MIKRRDFAFLLGAATMAPRVLLAQTTSRRFLVGWLNFGTQQAPLTVKYQGQFLTGMRELGYTEGQDFEMLDRFADYQADRLPKLAVEMIQLKPDVVVQRRSMPLRWKKQPTRFPLSLLPSPIQLNWV